MINCIIVDDEPLAATLLENHISKIDHLKLTGKAGNALEAYKLLQNQPVDLMFLDIQMPHFNGIDFLKSLSQKPKTVFTTAYRDFAIEGFELEAVDYLLKPITFERFFRSVERVLRHVNPPKEDFILFKTEGMYRKISLADIAYIESQGNDIKVTLSTTENFISKSKITDLESTLASKGFIRIHRSFIINTEFVTAFNNNEVHLGDYKVPVGRSYKIEFDTFITIISKRSINK
ncbi:MULTISPECIES: LytR/AlgR family response regulator transcription factor [Chryseobacterium]|uniref:DNA-binding response regulator n=1 Tax=Chryseobacterium pennae TaxID=2258962 RepID=A0A3D9C9S1_9FLAO|nr:LytTR family DNA-binding domain-containing protein [Chryseobacterium pennae]REC62448.1 DNA-binding response regulator [Chryseobacterium pennae]